ncbi:hypothetical protein DH2020_012655 [Rehmannia glutinosa]|uniref:Uncharacterized protein n=1 Tax=Rehmannia glutinosa TaxID=99300 RepID=A0ABR0X2I5_REHGL
MNPLDYWSRLTQSKGDGRAGLRKIHLFNVALLAKQVWRLVSSPESLAAQLSKAKYFPDGELLNAKLGYQPSFLWRSLLAARPTVLEGMAWRIGNGSNVHVFKYRWIRMTNFERPIRTSNALNPKLKVSELIDFEAKNWRFDFIRQNFNTQDANRICAMHLSGRFSVDRLIWRHSKNGMFSVKTTYYALKRQTETANTNHPSSSTPNGAWKKVWHL